VAKDKVFLSYSHKDKKWRDELETHLKPYLRNGIITSWSDQQIEPGSQWLAEIESALTNSRIAVLLVSPDFLGSDFIHEHELGPLLKKAEQGGAKILWIPIRSSAYRQTPLKNYQAIIDPSKPLAGMSKAKRDQALVEICERIQKEVNRTNESRQS
jgi:internalin A